MEHLLAERGTVVTSQILAKREANFALKFAHKLRRRSRGNFAKKRHPDKTIEASKRKEILALAPHRCKVHVLDGHLQNRRNKAAVILMRKRLNGQFTTPRVAATDKLRSYSAAMAELMPNAGGRTSLAQRIEELV